MSIGPRPKDEQVKVGFFHRAAYETKKVVETYFKNPLYYLFYGMLSITIVGLFFGFTFPWQYYVILITLAGVELYSKKKV